MAQLNASSQYPLGGSSAEHDRLIRQAARLAPYTERFFREVGIGPGQRVLDLGSGAGDVAILAAQLVGPDGQVVGIERDPQAVARARARVVEAGLHNVTFTLADVSQLRADNLFDAVVGRFILMYLCDPVAVLHSASQLLRPGGVVAFQEPSYAPFLLLSAGLPLWSRTVSLIEEVLRRSGANTEMGMALYRTFQQAGLPPPTVAMDIPLGNDLDFIAWASDTLHNLLPQLERLDLPIEAFGDLDTLPERLQAEISTKNTIVPWQGVVSAWCRVPLQ
jgi:ubiquinone/menaquinone biosynthesis C-methylase UbiE